MTYETRTADEIEQDIQRERSQMSETINNLQKKFSVEAIVNDVGAMFRGPGSDFGRSVTQTIGRNPVAVALVGVGLAWLVLGQGKGSDRIDPDAKRDLDRRYDFEPQHRNSVPDTDRGWFGDNATDFGDDQEFSQGTRHNAINDNGRDAGASQSWAESASAAAGAVSSAARSVRHKAADLTERFSAGTEGFSAEAKARVLAARQAAHDAQIASQDAMKRGGRAASNLFEEQPLVVGALAVALGAAMGGILPRTDIEDNALGANSDRMFAEAQRVFQEEKNKAMAVVNAAAAEAQNALKDAGSELSDLVPDGKTVGNAIVDRITEAATQVSDSAQDEARRQGLLTSREP